jgi:hypothetical protein
MVRTLVAYGGPIGVASVAKREELSTGQANENKGVPVRQLSRLTV